MTKGDESCKRGIDYFKDDRRSSKYSRNMI